MVDGRVFYHDLDPDLNAYSEMWNFLKSELFSPKIEAETDSCCEKNIQTKNYELNPELKEDLDSVKDIASGLENLGQSTQNSTS